MAIDYIKDIAAQVLEKVASSPAPSMWQKTSKPVK